jgi:hypothetical protein
MVTKYDFFDGECHAQKGHGDYVKDEDYEALKADRDAQQKRADALAVENAALKNFCKNAAFDADYESELCMERGGFIDAFNNIETPATDAALAAIEARGVEKFADKRGFSFQHGSVHAHFGNGDVMVGSTKFENGHAGICFAPVREKEGDVGTEYKWTEGKNTNDVGAVFVISSSSVAGLEVIQGKLSEAIEQLREAK